MITLFLCFEVQTFFDYKIKTRPINIGRALKKYVYKLSLRLLPALKPTPLEAAI